MYLFVFRTVHSEYGTKTQCHYQIPSKISFAPKTKALIDGSIICVSLKNTANGYVVIYNQSLIHCSMNGFEYAQSDKNDIDYVFIDDSKCALQAIVYNNKTNDLIFGSRKCNMFKINNEMDDEKDENDNVYFVNKCGLNSKDLDHI